MLKSKVTVAKASIALVREAGLFISFSHALVFIIILFFGLLFAVCACRFWLCDASTYRVPSTLFQKKFALVANLSVSHWLFGTLEVGVAFTAGVSDGSTRM